MTKIHAHFSARILNPNYQLKREPKEGAVFKVLIVVTPGGKLVCTLSHFGWKNLRKWTNLWYDSDTNLDVIKVELKCQIEVR